MSALHFLYDFFAKRFKTTVSYESFLNGWMLVGVKLTDRHWHTFFFGVGTTTMEFNMQEAYFTFEISYFILFLFDKDS